jgi:protein-disulfide isomerase
MKAHRNFTVLALSLAMGFAAAPAFAVFTSMAAFAADASPKPPSAKAPAPASGPVYREFVQGNPKAKVTVIEYASLTCPHCADFAKNDYPMLKKAYIDTGKIKYVYRDYPLDGLAMGAALLARCAPGDKGLTMIQMIFENQLTWVRADNPLEPLRGYAKQVGMNEADVDACLKNEGILDTMKQVQETATNLYNVNATPTFLVGDEQVAGADYDGLKKLIDKALAANTK